jgi:putative ABC transport system permease protein
MMGIIRIAFRNLYRQKRRTLLTVSIIAVGVTAVLLFTALAGSFKNMMIGQITDSMLGHAQIHRAGYVAAIDNMPLNRMIKKQQFAGLEKILQETPALEAYSGRIQFNAMLSNFLETTSIKVSAIDPEHELAVAPLLQNRIKTGAMLKPGEMLLPEMLAKGLNVTVGQDVVLVATNADGSVNGQNLKVAGIIESVVGPTGKYGYLHISDAVSLLRMDEPEWSEVALRLRRIGDLDNVVPALRARLDENQNKEGKNIFELHTWRDLSPFYNIAKMIDLMTMFIKVILVAIVLISIMNVMVMAVYERIREIGTLAAIGTLPRTIRAIFLTEGLLLGALGAVTGNVLGVVLVSAAKIAKLTIAFGQKDRIPLNPELPFSQMLMVALVILVVAAVAALEPAYKASKMDPVQALRHN